MAISICGATHGVTELATVSEYVLFRDILFLSFLLPTGTVLLFPYSYHVVYCTSLVVIHPLRGVFDHYANK